MPNIGSNAFSPFVGGPGLHVSISGGTILLDNVSTTLAATTLPLIPNAVNYIFIKGVVGTGSLAGTLTPLITSNITGFDGLVNIAVVVTNANGILSITDSRPDLIVY
jgi:hypothetical protein